MGTLILSEWNYQNADNPPILHRKETFVTRDYPLYQASGNKPALMEKAFVKMAKLTIWKPIIKAVAE